MMLSFPSTLFPNPFIWFWFCQIEGDYVTLFEVIDCSFSVTGEFDKIEDVFDYISDSSFTNCCSTSISGFVEISDGT